MFSLHHKEDQKKENQQVKEQTTAPGQVLDIKKKGRHIHPEQIFHGFRHAHYLLVDARKGKENKNKKAASPLKGAYRKHPVETTMMDRTRILSFWRKPPAPTNTNGNFQEETVLANLVKSSQQKRHIPKSADGALDAPELIDDYYLNLLDWRTGNILAIALGSTVYLSNASNGSVFLGALDRG
ncbi:hypothetical protein AAC387_Pa08g1377 [Persea americana]